MPYTIGEISKMLNVAPSTIRYYDKEGLLPFLERSKSGKRIFKDSDYEQLQIINCLKSTGLSLKDIKDYIYMSIEGDKTINERLQIFLKQREVVKQQIKELQTTLDIINFKCWYYETAKKAGTCSVPYGMKVNNEIPDEYQTTLKRLNNLPNTH